MRRASGEVQPLDVRTTVRGLEGPKKLTVAGQAIDGPVEHAEPLMNVLGRQPALEPNASLQVCESGPTCELVKDRTAVRGE